MRGSFNNVDDDNKASPSLAGPLLNGPEKETFLCAFRTGEEGGGRGRFPFFIVSVRAFLPSSPTHATEEDVAIHPRLPFRQKESFGRGARGTLLLLLRPCTVTEPTLG